MSRSKYHIVISRDENDSFKPRFVSRILSQADVDEGQLLQNRVKKGKVRMPTRFSAVRMGKQNNGYV